MLVTAAIAAFTSRIDPDSPYSYSPYSDGYLLPPHYLLAAAGVLSALNAFRSSRWLSAALAATGAALFAVTLLEAPSRTWSDYLIGSTLGLLPILAASTAARARRSWPPQAAPITPALLLHTVSLAFGFLITLAIGIPALLALLRGVLPYDWVAHASLLDQPEVLTTLVVVAIALVAVVTPPRLSRAE